MRVTKLSSSPTSGGGTRIEADVDGQPLWFESDDATLSRSAEAFGSALLIPASKRGERLEIGEAVDPAWLAHLAGISELLSSWWAYPRIEVVAEAAADASNAAADGTAQCFTGGVDSFYALIEAETPPDVLVMAHGFDIPLKDQRKFDAFVPGLNEVAATYDARPVIIRTNLRQHDAMKGVEWETSHGGALAALGHLLSGMCGRLVIPSTFPYHANLPWGSHWELDRLWSSSRMTLEHTDASLHRHEKARAIASNALVQRHLRVCPQRSAQIGNCSRCEKCIRTMLALELNGQLVNCSTFDGPDLLISRIDEMKYIPGHLLFIYADLRGEIPDPNLQAAVDRWISRTRRRIRRRKLLPRSVALWLRRWGRRTLAYLRS